MVIIMVKAYMCRVKVQAIRDYHCPSGTLPGKAPRLFTHSLYDTD